MAVDPEIEAMSTIASALGGLETRARVLRWAAERYGAAVVQPRRPEPGGFATTEATDRQRQIGGSATPDPVFTDFVDLFDAVDPKTDAEKALTAAYWLQVVSKQPSWQSLRVNNLLKDMGHGPANITATLRKIQSSKPALVRQVAKSGKAQQAWKTYKLTTSGVAYVRDKLGLSGSVPAALVDNGDE